MGLGAINCLVVFFMCGRTACTLAPEDVVKACCYQRTKGKRRRPLWKDAPGGQQYKTSYNMAPGSFSPVLVSSKHFKDVASQSEVDHVIMPMKWGLVPRWHKDSPSKVSFKTSNCRGESMLDKATFKIPLQQGRRCVAIMDGFYEWKTTSSGKQPYFFQFTPRDLQMENMIVHMKDENVQFKSENTAELTSSLSYKDVERLDQTKTEVKMEPLTEYNKERKILQNSLGENDSKDIFNIKISTMKQECNDGSSSNSSSASSSCDNSLHFKNENKSVINSGGPTQEADFSIAEEENTESWSGHKLLTCAAVYDVWQPPHASAPLYSYSIITVAASSDMSWCHHRMPAVLTTDQEICDWLDFSTIPLTQASSLIQPKSECLTSHPVSKNVNNSHYQSQDCLKPVDLSEEKQKLSGSGQMMMNWLKRGQASSTTGTAPGKKAKI